MDGVAVSIPAIADAGVMPSGDPILLPEWVDAPDGGASPPPN